ncbi:MAG: hypothetical protein WB952_26305 [Terriglobales bacterium]
MKRLAYAFCFLSLAAGFGLAQTRVDTTAVGQDNFDADFPSGGQLRLHIRSGDLRIIGSDENKIKIRFWGKNAAEARDVKVSLKTLGSTGDLRVHGGPHNDFQIEIFVPRTSDLYLRMPAGEAEVKGIVGNKDVEIHAGDLTLAVGAPEEYAFADASVLAGDLDAGPFGISKDGLFRSFHKQGTGRYKLHAHVGAGDLTLKP